MDEQHDSWHEPVSGESSKGSKIAKYAAAAAVSVSLLAMVMVQAPSDTLHQIKGALLGTELAQLDDADYGCYEVVPGENVWMPHEKAKSAAYKLRKKEDCFQQYDASDEVYDDLRDGEDVHRRAVDFKRPDPPVLPKPLWGSSCGIFSESLAEECHALEQDLFDRVKKKEIIREEADKMLKEKIRSWGESDKKDHVPAAEQVPHEPHCGKNADGTVRSCPVPGLHKASDEKPLDIDRLLKTCIVIPSDLQEACEKLAHEVMEEVKQELVPAEKAPFLFQEKIEGLIRSSHAPELDFAPAIDHHPPVDCDVVDADGTCSEVKEGDFREPLYDHKGPDVKREYERFERQYKRDLSRFERMPEKILRRNEGADVTVLKDLIDRYRQAGEGILLCLERNIDAADDSQRENCFDSQSSFHLLQSLIWKLQFALETKARIIQESRRFDDGSVPDYLMDLDRAAENLLQCVLDHRFSSDGEADVCEDEQFELEEVQDESEQKRVSEEGNRMARELKDRVCRRFLHMAERAAEVADQLKMLTEECEMILVGISDQVSEGDDPYVVREQVEEVIWKLEEEARSLMEQQGREEHYGHKGDWRREGLGRIIEQMKDMLQGRALEDIAAVEEEHPEVATQLETLRQQAVSILEEASRLFEEAKALRDEAEQAKADGSLSSEELEVRFEKSAELFRLIEAKLRTLEEDIGTQADELMASVGIEHADGSAEEGSAFIDHLAVFEGENYDEDLSQELAAEDFGLTETAYIHQNRFTLEQIANNPEMVKRLVKMALKSGVNPDSIRRTVDATQQILAEAKAKRAQARQEWQQKLFDKIESKDYDDSAQAELERLMEAIAAERGGPDSEAVRELQRRVEVILQDNNDALYLAKQTPGKDLNPRDWSAGAFTFAVEEGIVKPFQGKVRPGGELTCGQLGVMLSRLVEKWHGPLEASVTLTAFEKELPDWSHEDIRKLKTYMEAGFSMDDRCSFVTDIQGGITREDIIATLVEVVQKLVPGWMTDTDVSSLAANYIDEGDIAPEKKELIAAAVQARLAGQVSDRRLKPQDKVARDAVVTLMQRVIEGVLEKELIPYDAR